MTKDDLQRTLFFTRALIKLRRAHEEQTGVHLDDGEVRGLLWGIDILRSGPDK